jgi:hypothetical protein
MPTPCPKPVAKTAKKKRREKTEYQVLVAQLDDLVSQIVHLRDKNTCVICGSTARPQAGHVFVRDRKRVRWDLRNVHVQCASCNLRHRFDQAPYFYWFMQIYGKPAFDELYELAEGQPAYIWSIPDMRVLTRELEQMLASLL